MELIESLITASMAGVALLVLLLSFGFAALCVRKAFGRDEVRGDFDASSNMKQKLPPDKE